MGSYQLKPGVIHIKNLAISPFTHASTVLLEKGAKLDVFLEELRQKYKNRAEPTWERIKFTIDPTNWVLDGDQYTAHIGQLTNDKYRLYSIIDNMGLDHNSYATLLSDIFYKYIKAEIIENNIYINCNVKPTTPISGNLVLMWIYDMDVTSTVPKNLEVQLRKEHFTKIDDLDHIYKMKLPELDPTGRYHISCTFDKDNIDKFMLSNNRYIVAEYAYGEITVHVEFPFNAKVIFIIHTI